MSNACTARRASAGQSMPDPLPLDGDEDGADSQDESNAGGATVMAVPPLKCRGRAFSERILGMISGGRYTSSTACCAKVAGPPAWDAVASRASMARCRVNTTNRITDLERSQLDSYMSGWTLNILRGSLGSGKVGEYGAQPAALRRYAIVRLTSETRSSASAGTS